MYPEFSMFFEPAIRSEVVFEIRPGCVSSGANRFQHRRTTPRPSLSHMVWYPSPGGSKLEKLLLTQLSTARELSAREIESTCVWIAERTHDKHRLVFNDQRSDDARYNFQLPL